MKPGFISWVKLYFHCLFRFHRWCVHSADGKQKEIWCHNCDPNKFDSYFKEFVKRLNLAYKQDLDEESSES